MIRHDNHRKLKEAIQKSVPREAGIYLLKDKFEKAIYIGKSINLRDRMMSYFRQDITKLEMRTGRMIRAVESFGYLTTKSELQALLIEDYLIKKELPEYNTRQKQFDEYRYLLLTNDPFPTLHVVETPQIKEKGVTYGPYRDSYFIADLLEIAHSYLHIRECSDTRPVRKCMNYDVGKCPGPCRKAISAAEYRVITERVADFLNGNDSSVIADIRCDMKKAASSKLYEKANRVKKKLEFCRRFCDRQDFIRQFKSRIFMLRERREDTIKHLFDRGRWIEGRSEIAADAGGKKYFLVQDDDLVHDPRFLVDRANIIYNWIRKNISICEHCFLE